MFLNARLKVSYSGEILKGFAESIIFFPFMNLKWYNSDVERDQGLMTQ